MIVNPNKTVGRDLAKDAEAIAPKRNLKVQTIEVREPEALDGVFEQAGRQTQAVLLHADVLVVNLKTGKALGLTVPQSICCRPTG
jgi:hypothetical protein